MEFQQQRPYKSGGALIEETQAAEGTPSGARQDESFFKV